MVTNAFIRSFAVPPRRVHTGMLRFASTAHFATLFLHVLPFTRLSFHIDCHGLPGFFVDKSLVCPLPTVPRDAARQRLVAISLEGNGRSDDCAPRDGSPGADKTGRRRKRAHRENANSDAENNATQ